MQIGYLHSPWLLISRSIQLLAKLFTSEGKRHTHFSCKDKLEIRSPLQFVVKILSVFQAVVDLCFKPLWALKEIHLLFNLHRSDPFYLLIYLHISCIFGCSCFEIFQVSSVQTICLFHTRKGNCFCQLSIVLFTRWKPDTHFTWIRFKAVRRYLRLPHEPQFKDVHVSSTLNAFVPGVIGHVILLVRLEEILGTQLIAFLQEALKNITRWSAAMWCE